MSIEEININELTKEEDMKKENKESPIEKQEMYNVPKIEPVVKPPELPPFNINSFGEPKEEKEEEEEEEEIPRIDSIDGSRFKPRDEQKEPVVELNNVPKMDQKMESTMDHPMEPMNDSMMDPRMGPNMGPNMGPKMGPKMGPNGEPNTEPTMEQNMQSDMEPIQSENEPKGSIMDFIEVEHEPEREIKVLEHPNPLIYSGYLEKLSTHGRFQRRLFRFDGLILTCLTQSKQKIPHSSNLLNFQPMFLKDGTEESFSFLDTIGTFYPNNPVSPEIITPLVAVEKNSNPAGTPDLKSRQYYTPKVNSLIPWII